jgi:hypothetical protein
LRNLDRAAEAARHGARETLHAFAADALRAPAMADRAQARPCKRLAANGGGNGFRRTGN